MKLDESQMKKLCLELVKAETEEEAIEILKNRDLWSSEEYWYDYGGKENNYAQIGNQQSQADQALTEKITNAVDAVLMRETLKRNIDPEGP